jgi:hypothetical protein
MIGSQNFTLLESEPTEPLSGQAWLRVVPGVVA